ncbi:GTP-dependent dephospho-CoA kinase family protein [Candidatus Nitrosotenuis chungbukensis]|uniref:GTP-dependent dephospho-CoA kinase family protein n=1 Tax=Candidatus Nitrosotenuis chungbukensis TaxID=1353246 RepID=UPI0005B28C2C|nr:GTP-dependent dephospho-CoA kinase family protein [Candidatus Nitrosotenuis chungbukensis]WKT57847.1 GTP-dependent dephospho-CoA kinase family protein [Candidatus Nitrosotenuis chungbukensis]
MKLPESLREQLKTPLGVLLRDTSKENILHHIPKGSFIITVGDATTEKILSFGMIPSLSIVDGFEKRQKRDIPSGGVTKMSCDNPAGQITAQSIDTIRNALKSKLPVQIMVSGEEDLLVLPVCVHAPQNSVVLYGQPNEGLVIVKVTQEIRNKTQQLLNLMN